MIKQLMKYQLIDINKFILKFYLKMNLTEKEAFVLIQLFSMYDKNKVVLSYTQLRTRLTLDKKEVNQILQSLTEKNIVDLEIEIQKNGKEQEILRLEKAIMLMEELMKNDEIEDEKKAIELQLKDIIDLIEKEMARTLAPTEMQLITSSLKGVAISNVEDAIYNVAKGEKLTVKGIIDYLETKDQIEKKVDKKDEEAILGFFNSINKKS